VAGVVSGVVVALTADTVTIATGTDPDTGETLTVTAALPRLELGAVAYLEVGAFGAVAFPAAAGGAGPTVVEFRTFAELRDGIIVPRPPALREDDDQ
jgi:hypothetical protein